MGKCNIGGSTIDWVMKTQGVSFRHAVELLRADHPALSVATTAAGPGRVVRKGTTAKLASPIALDADDQQTLRDVVGFYYETLKNPPEALRYLEGRGLVRAEMFGHFQSGLRPSQAGARRRTRTARPEPVCAGACSGSASCAPGAATST